MDFIPENNDVNKIEQTTGPLPLPIVQNQAVLEEEITSVAVDHLVSQQTPNYANNDSVHSPDRLVHFSDGTMTQAEVNMETALGDEQLDSSGQQPEQQVALPDTLIEVYRNLGILGKILNGGSLVTLRVLQAFGNIGESVIDFLGITRPKYEYEINLAKDMQQQEQARNDKIENLYSTWQGGQSAPSVPVSVPVQPVPSVPGPSSTPINIPVNLPPPPPLLISQPSYQAQPPPPVLSTAATSSVLPPNIQPTSTFIPPLPTAATLPSPPEIYQAYPPEVPALLSTQSFATIPETPTENLSPVSEVPEAAYSTSELSTLPKNPATTEQSDSTGQTSESLSNPIPEESTNETSLIK